MIWKNLQIRCLETVARDPRCVAQSDRCLGAVHRSQLIAWLAAHDLITNPIYYRHIIRKIFNRHIKGLDLDLNQIDNDCLEWLGIQCDNLEALKISCCFKPIDVGLSKMLKQMKKLRWLEIRELKVERNDLFDEFRSANLERVILQLYIRDYDWNGLEMLIETNPTIRHFIFNARGRTLRREDALLLKISDFLQNSLVDIELDNFASEKGPLSVLLLTCRQLKRIKLAGSMQFDLDTMTRCKQICHWESLDLTFQVTPPRETYDALQCLPTTLTELGFKFGPSNRNLIVNSFSQVPNVTKIRYHTEFFNDQLVLNLLSSVNGASIETLDIGLCENLTDDGLDVIADTCKNLRSLYLHSDVNKYNRQATGMPLCRLIENPLCSNQLRILYFNYFKMLSPDFLQLIAVECSNLEEIHLAAVRSVNDQILKLFAQRCRRLKCVDINGCWAVTDKGVIELANNLDLLNLNVGMCYRLTNKCIEALARNCPNLERFLYHGIPGMRKSPTMAELQLYCVKRLKTYLFQWYL